MSSTHTKALLVYPEIPPTYWSLKYALSFIGKKTTFPPVGLLTVAALLPRTWEIRLVDMNVGPLKESAVKWADIVLTSSMVVQKESLERVIALCKSLGKPVVAGGPYPTSSHEAIAGVDHFVLNEAEVTLPLFLADYDAGKARPIYSDPARPDITKTPPPRFDLIRRGRYAAMALQYSRGCPHSCEFCDIIQFFGRYPRTKTPGQFLAEMDIIYGLGFRGSLFVLDDNFIGNRKSVRELLPGIASWQRRRHYPFDLFTEATVSLAEDDELMALMVDAGFNMVFLGIETPDADTLACANKPQNLRGDLLESVRRIQKKGMEVTGGFIVGFDSDKPDIFDRQIQFIQKSGIYTAMVGLLTAMPNTQLYERLKAENRLLETSSGNNTHDLRLNFLPRMDVKTLMEGYKKILAEIYSPKPYFERCLAFLRNLTPHRNSVRKITYTELRAFALSLLRQTFSSYGWEYWRFLVRGFLLKPRMLAETVTMAIKGHHFFKITKGVLAVERFKARIESLEKAARERLDRIALPDTEARLAELRAFRDRASADLRREYRRIHRDFRRYAEESLADFEAYLDSLAAANSASLAQGA